MTEINAQTQRVIDYIDSHFNVWQNLIITMQTDRVDNKVIGLGQLHSLYYSHSEEYLNTMFDIDMGTRLHQNVWEEFFNEVDLRQVCEHFDTEL